MNSSVYKILTRLGSANPLLVRISLPTTVTTFPCSVRNSPGKERDGCSTCVSMSSRSVPPRNDEACGTVTSHWLRAVASQMSRCVVRSARKNGLQSRSSMMFFYGYRNLIYSTIKYCISCLHILRFSESTQAHREPLRHSGQIEVFFHVYK